MSVTACGGPASTLDVASPAASGIATLWWVMLAGAAVLTTLVMALLTLTFVRSRRNRETQPVLWVGWLGVAMPGAVLAVLLAYALVLGERLIPHRVPGIMVVEATGHQWYWTFRQPSAAGIIGTRDILHIPSGRPVDVRISSADVIHSFWAPRLGGKMDAIPGQVNVLRIEASKPGTYHGLCAEFCGLNHTSNRFRVVAHDEAGWAAFQRSGAR